jgi:hypothetical protein
VNTSSAWITIDISTNPARGPLRGTTTVSAAKEGARWHAR